MSAPAPPSPGHAASTFSEPALVHASCVARAGRAVLIRGASGSGKSSLALQLLALGAVLVADDRVQVQRIGDAVLATAPAALHNRIEARSIGLLRVPAAPDPQPLALLVDMDLPETDRLPPPRTAEVLGLRFPLVRKSCAAHFPAAVLQYLLHGKDA